MKLRSAINPRSWDYRGLAVGCLILGCGTWLSALTHSAIPAVLAGWLGAGWLMARSDSRRRSAAPAEEAPSWPSGDYLVRLVGAGSLQIKVIKEIRSITGLPLRPAYEMVRDLPSTVIAQVDEASAQQIAASLEAFGARVEVERASLVED
ncbi:Ribosomal protein L7/L12 C-terminal domain-containing protein [Frankineae bacterium MT45]|nr:Ribosomal protein L7/L12 C-terminal domain-containing protein [Frankineae bacterium MT45]